jgi:tetratricopeptide (TPR) repeat protein
MVSPSNGSSGPAAVEPDADTPTRTGSRKRMPTRRSLQTGSTVGRYIVLERIGQGGMGVVFRAYDPRLQRELALKVVRPGSLGDAAQERLLREARAMARLSHPNVVAVYDVETGEDDGVVLAMELVPGSTLRAWLQQRRPWRAVVERFVEAGRGLAAAHAVGLLHRDFKPTNVLLGADGRARVSDFGLARASGSFSGSDLHNEPASRSPVSTSDGVAATLTDEGAVLGTLAYMPPEQHDAAELTEAVDQYAFCASLWHGLTGALPFDGRSEHALDRAKRDGAPAWPRGVAVPGHIVAALRRGLSPDPAARWSSMNELLHALRTESRARRWALLGAGAVVVGLAAWGGVTQLSASGQLCEQGRDQLATAWDDERRAAVDAGLLATGADHAPRVRDTVLVELDAYADAWVRAYDDSCAATHVRGDQSPAALDLRMTCLQRARGEAQHVVDLLAEADLAVLDGAYRLVDGLAPLERCSDLDALKNASPLPSDPQEAAAAERALAGVVRGRALAVAGRFDDAQAAVEHAVEELGDVEYPPASAEAAVLLARFAAKRGDTDEAIAALEAALADALATDQHAAATEAATQLVFFLGHVQRRHDVAEAYVAVAQGLVERPEASEVEKASFLNHRAALRSSQLRVDEAEADYRAALSIRERINGRDDPETILVRSNVAGVMVSRGKADEALTEIDAVVAASRAAWGDRHPQTLHEQTNLGFALQAAGRLEDAAAHLQRIVAIAEDVLPAAHPIVIGGLTYLALVEQQLEHHERTAELTGRVVELQAAKLGADHIEVARARMNHGRALNRAGRTAEAIELGRAALQRLEPELGADHPEVLEMARSLGIALHHAGRNDEALPYLERALAGGVARQAPPAELAGTRFNLAKVLWTLGHDRARARALAETAATDHRNAGPHKATAATEVERWLAGLQ